MQNKTTPLSAFFEKNTVLQISDPSLKR